MYRLHMVGGRKWENAKLLSELFEIQETQTPYSFVLPMILLACFQKNEMYRYGDVMELVF